MSSLTSVSTKLEEEKDPGSAWKRKHPGLCAVLKGDKQVTKYSTLNHKPINPKQYLFYDSLREKPTWAPM